MNESSEKDKWSKIPSPLVRRSGMNKSEMRHQISRLNRINSDVADYKTIKQIYDRMFDGVMSMIGTTSGAELFFRARLNPVAKPTRIREMGAPPAEAVNGFQRCNAPHEPMFYCSSRRITALMECRVSPGDTVYLGQLIGRDKLPVSKVFDARENVEFGDSLNDAEALLYTHLDTLFTRRIHHTFSNDYKFSSAVSEQLTVNFPPGDFNVKEDGRIGIRYPSVFDLEGSYNTAFPPEFFGDRLNLLHVAELKVEDVDGDNVSVRLLDTAKEFKNDEIIWSGKSNSIPAARSPDGGVLFRSDGLKWDVLTTEHLPVPIEMSAEVLRTFLAE